MVGVEVNRAPSLASPGAIVRRCIGAVLVASAACSCGIVKVEMPSNKSGPSDEEVAAAKQQKAEEDGPCGGIIEQPKRAYLKSEGRGIKHDPQRRSVEQGDFDPIPTVGGMRDRTTWLPPNTAVDVVRRIELRGTGVQGTACGLVAVRVVDAGGAAEPGSVFAIPAGLVADQPSGDSPAEAVQRKRAEGKAAQDERVAAARAVVERELQTGRCSDEHVERLRGGLQLLTASIKNDPWLIVAHKFAVATKDGALLSLTAGTAGEHHVFAVAFRKGELTALDAQGYRVGAASDYDALVAGAFNLPTRSAVVTTNAGDELKLKVKGEGCALVLALRHL